MAEQAVTADEAIGLLENASDLIRNCAATDLRSTRMDAVATGANEILGKLGDGSGLKPEQRERYFRAAAAFTRTVAPLAAPELRASWDVAAPRWAKVAA